MENSGPVEIEYSGKHRSPKKIRIQKSNLFRWKFVAFFDMHNHIKEIIIPAELKMDLRCLLTLNCHV
jgi:hypothetical protein